MARYVYDVTERPVDMAELLGGRGAGLAEMTRIGLPAARPAASREPLSEQTDRRSRQGEQARYFDAT